MFESQYTKNIELFKKNKEADYLARLLNAVPKETLESGILTEVEQIRADQVELEISHQAKKLKSLKLRTMAALVAELREELAAAI